MQLTSAGSHASGPKELHDAARVRRIAANGKTGIIATVRRHEAVKDPF